MIYGTRRAAGIGLRQSECPSRLQATTYDLDLGRCVRAKQRHTHDRGRRIHDSFMASPIKQPPAVVPPLRHSSRRTDSDDQESRGIPHIRPGAILACKVRHALSQHIAAIDLTLSCVRQSPREPSPRCAAHPHHRAVVPKLRKLRRVVGGWPSFEGCGSSQFPRSHPRLAAARLTPWPYNAAAIAVLPT